MAWIRPENMRQMTRPVLTYCTNIHPARGMDAVRDSIERVSVPLKERISPNRPFPLGLRLADEESRELMQVDALPHFRDWLTERGFTVACINGFPFGPFHGGRVKDEVHRPDWSDAQRVEYTIRLGRILCALPRAAPHGGISTSPLSYKPWGRLAPHEHEAMTANIARIAVEFARLAQSSDFDLHLDIEPEPDGLLETADEFARWFSHELLPVGVERLRAALGQSESDADAELRRRIAVCLDTCHSAIEFEDPEAAITTYTAAGIRIGRIQVSSALRVPIPNATSDRAAIRQALAPFAESTYLHQTIGRRPDGSLDRWPDLDAALPNLNATDATEWRIHFHVPIFHAGESPLFTTQPQTQRLIQLTRERNLCDIFEAETYTWSVLPQSLQFDVVDSIERELTWLHGQLHSMPRSPT